MRVLSKIGKHQKPLKRYDFIDALRGLAIILVLIAHTGLYGSNNVPGWFNSLTAIDVGPRGVQLFFLVSAFTLSLSFSKRSRREKHPIRNFYIRRFFRIAPLFYLAVFYYVWQAYAMNHHIYSFANIAATMLFMNGFSPYWINNIVLGGWSIAVETTFYVVFPFLFLKLKTIRISIITTFFAMIASQIFRLYLLSLPIVKNTPDIQTFTFQLFTSQLPIFLLGITLFLLLKTTIAKKDFTVIKVVVAAMTILLGMQIFFGFKIVAGHYIYALLFAALLYILDKCPFFLLVNPIMAYLGKISFGLYLCHIAVLQWLSYFQVIDVFPQYPVGNFFIRFLLLLGCSVIIATILHFAVEKTGIKIGKKIIDKYENGETASI